MKILSTRFTVNKYSIDSSLIHRVKLSSPLSARALHKLEKRTTTTTASEDRILNWTSSNTANDNADSTTAQMESLDWDTTLTSLKQHVNSGKIQSRINALIEILPLINNLRNVLSSS
jgi:hypothetical protein